MFFVFYDQRTVVFFLSDVPAANSRRIMDASIIYERFLHMEIDKLSIMRVECAFCDNYCEYHKMIYYDGKKFCCEQCAEDYEESREE